MTVSDDRIDAVVFEQARDTIELMSRLVRSGELTNGQVVRFPIRVHARSCGFATAAAIKTVGNPQQMVREAVALLLSELREGARRLHFEIPEQSISAAVIEAVSAPSTQKH